MTEKHSKIKVVLGYLLIPFCVACGQNTNQKEDPEPATLDEGTTVTMNASENTISGRFNPPSGYERIAKDSTSFAQYLRNLPLKPDNALVHYYDGSTKSNRGVYKAVIDLPIGKRDLHQCADAVMRLRAEYLFGRQKYDSIHFNFTNGFRADYAKWRTGKRIVVDGNRVFWKQRTTASDQPDDFWKYLEMVFSYAGTASLSKELKPVTLSEMQIGDVFIQGGFPGHAVIIVDMATNIRTGKSLFLLAQSYMPAQELQLLANPNSSNQSPWYSAAFAGNLTTPEWVFKKTDLKRFAD